MVHYMFTSRWFTASFIQSILSRPRKNSIKHSSMHSKHLIIVIILFLVVALISGSSYTVRVFAVPPDPGWKSSTNCSAHPDSKYPDVAIETCCWKQSSGTDSIVGIYC